MSNYTTKNASSLIDAANEQLSLFFINEENKENNSSELSHINRDSLIRLIVKLVSIIKDNNIFAEKVSENLGLIKKLVKSYKDFETLKEIEEYIEYIFLDTLGYSKDFSEHTESSDEYQRTLIELSKLGVFND
jgi:hypothetical protein